MTGLLTVLMAGALATAGPAAAIEDPTRPDSQVTRGPSCRPGGIVVEVVAGTAPYAVRLSTSRTPTGEDEVTLTAGASAVLQTGDVAPGETIDPRLEFTALDGSGATFVDELDDYTLTRPTTEDCDAATSPPPPAPAPASPAPTSTVVPGSPSPSQTRPVPSTTSRPSSTTTTTTAGTSTTGATTSRTTSGPTTGTSSRTSGTVVPTVDGPARGDGQQVVAGGTVSLRGEGFLPGEQVNVLLAGTDTVLATAIAGSDGRVDVDVPIPTGATAGPATIDLVGVDSAQSTGVRLQVAAAGQAVDLAPRGALSLASLIAAATALVLTAAALVSVAGTRHAERRGRSAASS